jgi:hypothetical protein
MFKIGLPPLSAMSRTPPSGTCTMLHALTGRPDTTSTVVLT